MRAYLDASAAAKLVISERETEALKGFLDSLDDTVEVISSVLLETELRRATAAHGAPQATATDVLDGVDLVAAPRSLFRDAGLLAVPTLRSLDALHLATALRSEASVLVTYDHRLLDAARLVGIRTANPT